MTVPKDEEEVLRWLPEINAIDGQVRDETLELFTEHVPDYLWVVRASKNHHPVDHRGQHGLIIHIKRSFSAWLRVERMFKELSLIDSFEANAGRAAILAHDAFKYGKSEWKDDDALYHQYIDDDHKDIMIGVPKWTDREHGSVCADYIEEHFDMPEEVADCVRTHNGGWTDDPNPETSLELAHHLADAYSSDQRGYYRIYDPEDVFGEYLHVPDPVVDPENETDVEEIEDI